MLSVLSLSLSLTLGLAATLASPTGTREEYFSFPPPEIAPNKPLGEDPGFKLCKKSPIRYNPQHFVCHDNEILCPILDQGSEHPNPMQRCGDTCYDVTETTCADNTVIPDPPKRSWELGVDLAFAHHIKHFPNPSVTSVPTDKAEEEAATQALLKGYSLAFDLSREEQTVLYKRYDELNSESLAVEKDQLREEDAGLRVDKRSARADPYPIPWRRESMKPPVVRVKQTWDPMQRHQEMQQQGKVENGRSRAVEGPVTGEEKFPHPWQRLMKVEVKAIPEEELGFVERPQREEGEYEEYEYEGSDYGEGGYEQSDYDEYEESDDEGEYGESDNNEDEYEDSDYDEDEYEDEYEYDEYEYDGDDEGGYEADEELDYEFLRHMEDLEEYLSRVH